MKINTFIYKESKLEYKIMKAISEGIRYFGRYFNKARYVLIASLLSSFMSFIIYRLEDTETLGMPYRLLVTCSLGRVIQRR